MSIIKSQQVQNGTKPVKNYYWDIECEKFNRVITIPPVGPITKPFIKKAATKMTVY